MEVEKIMWESLCGKHDTVSCEDCSIYCCLEISNAIVLEQISLQAPDLTVRSFGKRRIYVCQSIEILQETEVKDL